MRWWGQLPLFTVAFFVLRGWMQSDMVNGSAPSLQGTPISGGYFSLDTPRTEPLLLHFWASWCPVCKLEQEGIESIAQDHAVVTIAMQSGTAMEVEHYLQEQQMQAATLVDEDGSLSQRFGVSAVPATFILSPDNQIRFVERGFTTELGLRTRIWLTQQLYSR